MFETASFRFLETRHDPHEVIGVHCHSAANLCLVLEGAVTEYGNDFSIAARAGAVLVHLPGDELSATIGTEPLTCLHVLPRPSWMRYLGVGDGRDHAFHCMARSFEILSQVQSIKDCWHGPTPADDFDLIDRRLALESLVLQVLIEFARENQRRRTRDWLEHLRKKIESDPFHAWTLEACAGYIGRPSRDVAAAFRTRYGEALGQYFRHCRMDSCRRLVREGKMSLIEIAHLAGFADQSHFSREYKKAFGSPPAQGRSTARTA